MGWRFSITKKKKESDICAAMTVWAVMSETVVWIQLTAEMWGSQEAMIHRASSFVAPGDENLNEGPYLARSLPKHTWRHMAKCTHINKNTDRDKNLTAKHKVEFSSTTAVTWNLMNVFDYFHRSAFRPSQTWWCINYLEKLSGLKITVM